MKFNDAIFGAVFVVFALAMISYTRTFPSLHGQKFGPADFPSLIGFGMLICGSILLFRGVQSNLKGSLVGGALMSIGDWITNHSTKFNVALVLASIIGFILLVDVIGFVLMSLIILINLFARFGNSLKTSVISAVVVTVGIKILFGTALLVPLPIGFLGF